MEKILEKLYSLHRRGIAPGLERMQEMLRQLGNPHLALNSLHVAGTNGKGTVTSIIASVLREAGEDVGIYTSPHIRAFNERIRVNGTPITDEEIIELYHKVEPIADQVGATFFEVTTVMAFLKFQHSTTSCSIECGLGGRLDATNVLLPRVAVITSIDYDHREWLGDTLEQIAKEKAGIMKRGIPVIIGEPRRELRDVFVAKAEEVGVQRLVFLDDLEWDYKLLEHTYEGMHLELRIESTSFRDLFLPFHGEHQVRNLAIAILAVMEYFGYDKASVCADAIVRGVARVKHNSGLYGRIEVVRQKPLVVIDVAHNPAGCRALAATIRNRPFPARWNVVFGAMRDKEIPAMLKELAPIADRFFLASPQQDRAESAERLFEICQKLGLVATSLRTIEAAVTAALNEGKPTLCVGSFFVIEEALRALNSSQD
ncbi:MAG: folylpolyglutamate synthase/dihydrofolate synthase family protein [Bacteroidota bacterium]|nr:folylpolyglutamate synthase/dihydrofolate synthase family protein [Bacteroidota bacterium]